jgi:predicted nucleic acid-binding protein
VIRGLDTSFLILVEVANHPGHEEARKVRDRLLSREDTLAIAPQVLAEFIHVVTDGRRFSRPLTMEQARERAAVWWHAMEVRPVFPNQDTTPLFFRWLGEHGLGRKRLLDTLLAATYWSNEVRSVVTSNARDFRTFGCFDVLEV